jgi:pimeloyl-ACP methyl ester carboxylesterase
VTVRQRKPEEKSANILGYNARYLHYTCAHPRATLLCFHGWLDNAASFTTLANTLADYEIYAWDFLGHGKSEHKHAGERYHYIDLVPFIDAAWQSVEAPHKVLVGHSMGAGACALYAGAAAHHVKRLVLIEGFSPMTAEPEDAAKILAEGVKEFKKAQLLPKPDYKTIADAVKIRMRVNGLSETAALPLVKRAIMRTKTGITWRADFRLRAPSLLRMTQAQVKSILQSIEARTLVILGDKGMPELKKAATTYSGWIKQGTVETLSGHHHLHMEKSSGVAERIAAFLRQV